MLYFSLKIHIMRIGTARSGIMHKNNFVLKLYAMKWYKGIQIFIWKIYNFFW